MNPSRMNPHEHDAGIHWKAWMSRARSAWKELTAPPPDDTENSNTDSHHESLLTLLQEHYGLEHGDAVAELESLLARYPQASRPRKDMLERLSEMNGNMTVNQYVQNPAPGPSDRTGPQGENKVRGKSSPPPHSSNNPENPAG